jgi:hypothetical protein
VEEQVDKMTDNMVDLTADEATPFWTAADEPEEGWRTTPQGQSYSIEGLTEV